MVLATGDMAPINNNEPIGKSVKFATNENLDHRNPKATDNTVKFAQDLIQSHTSLQAKLTNPISVYSYTKPDESINQLRFLQAVWKLASRPQFRLLSLFFIQSG